MGFEAQDPGVVAKILVQPGQEVSRNFEERSTAPTHIMHSCFRRVSFGPLSQISVGTPILVIVDDADDVSFSSIIFHLSKKPH